MTTGIIDGYSHCGLRKYRRVEYLNRIMDRYGVSRAVLVQHLGEYDHSYIESVVAANPNRFAGVFIANTDCPDPQADLAHVASKNIFRGIRLIANTLHTHPNLWAEAVAFGLNIIAFDPQTIALHTDALLNFAQTQREGNIILAHLGMPALEDSPAHENHRRLLALAECSNVYVQISGMHMFDDPPYNRLVPLIKQFVAAFGAKHLLYSSNFPVMQEDSVYARELELFCGGRLGIPALLVDQVVGQTTRDLWFKSDDT
jgi:predicted TIM-barrel fold metal-dependent hydrolase